MKIGSIIYQESFPDLLIEDVVEQFWMIMNGDSVPKEIVVIPDGRIDLFVTKSIAGEFEVKVLGLTTVPSIVYIPAGFQIFSISFKLPGIELFLKEPVSNIVNSARPILAANLFGINQRNWNTFEEFCDYMNARLLKFNWAGLDRRKLNLFHKIYSSKGSARVEELAKESGWNARQINRYFNHQFGVNLKLFCRIIRFRDSLNQIRNGNLSGVEYYDQSHFIKEICRLSGATPKEIKNNKNDRFIQFSVLARE